MELILKLFALLGGIAALLAVGEFLDRWLKDDITSQLSEYLAVPIKKNLAEWLHETHKVFLTAFNGIYGKTWNKPLEEALWAGLLISPIVLLAIETANKVHGASESETRTGLILALMALAGITLFCLLA